MQRSAKRRHAGKPKAPTKFALDSFADEILSSDDESEKASDDISLSDNEDLDESAAQKRIRLAKTYLSKIGERTESSNDLNVTAALKDERLESQGKLFRVVSETIIDKISDSTSITLCGHKASVTCVCLSSTENYIFSGSKDNSIVSWDTETGKKIRCFREAWSRRECGQKQSHEGEVLSIAISTDERYLVSGCKDGLLRVYDVRTPESLVRTLSGHRGAITSLSFRKDSSALFSGSADRCVKHWDLNEMGYIETLFGHQDEILSLDCWTKEKPVTSSADRTLRIWKVAEGSHLVLRGEKSSIDAVQVLTEDSYVAGAQDGSLSLWSDSAKKAVASHGAAHGFENDTNARWVVSLAAIKMSDVVASGSYDGYVRLWRADAHGSKRIEEIGALPVRGFVNSLALSTNLIVAGSGNEHKLGRWWHIPGNLNKITVWRLHS